MPTGLQYDALSSLVTSPDDVAGMRWVVLNRASTQAQHASLSVPSSLRHATTYRFDAPLGASLDGGAPFGVTSATTELDGGFSLTVEPHSLVRVDFTP